MPGRCWKGEDNVTVSRTVVSKSSQALPPPRVLAEVFIVLITSQ